MLKEEIARTSGHPLGLLAPGRLQSSYVGGQWTVGPEAGGEGKRARPVTIGQVNDPISGSAAAMDLMTGLTVFAQAQPGAANSNTIGLLALRRWCGGLTLSSPRAVPGWHGLGVLLTGMAVLLLVVLVAQGPVRALRQLLDIPGHARLLRNGIRRMRRAGGVIAAVIGFTVVSWTGAESMVFNREGGRTDLISLTRSRSLGELAVEQGILAGMTPLRDVAGLADNLPLLFVAVIVLFRASVEPQRSGEPSAATGQSRGRGSPGWTMVSWGVGALYILYRLVARAAGSPELPYGNCLVIEAVLIPAAMAIVDGFLLAWLLVELRNAGLDGAVEHRGEPLQAVALMPAAVLGCIAALPARYVAALVLLANDHMPTSVQTTALGHYIRWQLGDWGLADIQAGALVFVGLVGVVAWTRGRTRDAITGYGRLLAAEGGHLIATLAMAAVAASLVSAAAYAVVLLLPVQSWVLNAADSYAHFATLPIGLWTLAALIELGQRSLPTATPFQPAARTTEANRDPGRHHPAAADALPPVTAPAS
jgi:hypothetical protein